VKDTALVTTALKVGLWWRDHTDRRVVDGLIYHSDAGFAVVVDFISRKRLFWAGLRHQSAT
jgi:hypothetical protein